jgi:exonuclease SbcC
LKPKIEYLASNYFKIITNYKYSSITLDWEYRIKIDEKPLNLYSWGEQDLANLCLRIALWQNLSITNSGNMINFLILDEVLWSQDNNRQNNILLALRKLETKFSQIILISHIDWLKDVWDNLLEVKSIDNLESEILEK